MPAKSDLAMFIKLLRQTIIILSITGIILPSFSVALTQTPKIETPETLEEAKEMGKKAGEELKRELPGILEKIWKEEVLPLWQKMWDWFKNIWDTYLWPKIEPRIKEEIEKRRPIIEEELEKEKKEMMEEIKEQAPKVGKNLWERFKDLIK